MDNGLNKAFEKLTEALAYTRNKHVVSIRACLGRFDSGYEKGYLSLKDAKEAAEKMINKEA